MRGRDPAKLSSSPNYRNSPLWILFSAKDKKPMLGVVVWDAKRRKAIHMSGNFATNICKQMFAGSAETQREEFNKQILVVSPVYTPSSYG